MGNAIEWQDRPLCVRYGMLAVQTASLRISDPISDTDLSLWWAVGFLSNGDRDVLGVWKADTWADILSDLERRGTKEVRFLLSPDLQTIAPSSESRVGALPLISAAIDHESSTPGLYRAGRLRLVMSAASADVDHLRTSVDRAIAKQGRFASERDATNLVVAALVKAEAELSAADMLIAVARPRVPRRTTAIAEAAPR